MAPLEPLAPVALLRRVLADAVRSRVAGSVAENERIFTARGKRWFTPDDAICVVHADAAMFVGGLRALVLQGLHPLAMAGVAAHSGYRGDPWGRLQRTSHYLTATTYGTIADAERTIRRVRAVHRTVTGHAPDGRPYRATDPHLLAWVHLAEVDSFLVAYRRFGAHRLTDHQADEYVRQTGFVAAKLGVVDPPDTVDELRARLRAYRPELAGTPGARDTARYLLFTPPVPLLARPAYGLLATAAIATLPAWARRHAVSTAAAAGRRRRDRRVRRPARHPGVPLDALRAGERLRL